MIRLEKQNQHGEFVKMKTLIKTSNGIDQLTQQHKINIENQSKLDSKINQFYNRVNGDKSKQMQWQDAMKPTAKMF